MRTSGFTSDLRRIPGLHLGDEGSISSESTNQRSLRREGTATLEVS